MSAEATRQRAVDDLSLPGHDRDCARAIMAQSRLYASLPLDDVQVAHLLAIGYRAGVAAGRRQAAEAIRAFAESLPGGLSSPAIESVRSATLRNAARIAAGAPAEPVEETDR